MQVTTRSPMGAIAYQSGGLVVDGWLRTLALDEGMSVYPFLWTREVNERPPSRRPAALRELVALGFETARKLDAG